jgi:hypothetical protein
MSASISVSVVDAMSAQAVAPSARVGPANFELLKVIGKGGYGKVLRLYEFVGSDSLSCALLICQGVPGEKERWA